MLTHCWRCKASTVRQALPLGSATTFLELLRELRAFVAQDIHLLKITLPYSQPEVDFSFN